MPEHSHAAQVPCFSIRAPRSRGAGLFAGGVALLCWLAAAGLPAQAQPDATPPLDCPTAVQVEGEPSLVAPITEALARRGIVSQPPPGCPLSFVRVDHSGESLVVILHQELAAAARTVSDSAVATALIESWLRTDITGPLLAVPVLPEPPPTPSLTPIVREPPRARVYVSLLLEPGIDRNSTAWLGGSLNICRIVGPLCLGVLMRAAAAVPDALTATYRDRRVALDLLASAGLPIQLSRVTLVPGIGLGAGLLYHQAALRASVSPSDGDDPPTVVEIDGGVRAELRLVAMLRLRARWYLIGGLSLDAALIDGTAAEKQSDESLPPVSWGTLRGGLGLAWSAP